MINRWENGFRAVGRGFIPGTMPIKSTWALAPAGSTLRIPKNLPATVAGEMR
jgi:hypothetical protein